jgi:hypothetical protein
MAVKFCYVKKKIKINFGGFRIMKIIFLFFLPLLLLEITYFQGCPNHGATTIPITTIQLGSTQQPKVGSIFTYDSDTLNSNGIPTIGFALTPIDSVMQTGMSYSGKSNVMHVYETDIRGNSKDTYYNYESNGDISVNFPNAAPLPPWLKLSIHSSDTTVQILVDSMNGQVHIVEGDSVVNEGVFNTTVNGTVLPTVKFKMTLFIQSTVAGVTSSSSVYTTFYSIAPSIGYFTELLVPANHSSYGSDQTLFSFKLK